MNLSAKSTPKMYVYAIGLKKDFVEPFENCYIGISNKPRRRYSEHKRSKFTVGQYIRKHDLTIDENMIIVSEGTAEECIAEEHRRRPKPYMGLNESMGGKSAYTPDRNLRLGNSKRGIPKTQEQMSETAIKNGSHLGKKNGRAKEWRIFDPSGNEYVIAGEFISFCKQNKISHAALRRHLDVPVPELNPISKQIKGKFRKIRNNTVGWRATF